jgi:VanZ like family
MKIRRKTTLVMACAVSMAIWVIAPVGRTLRAVGMPFLHTAGRIIGENFTLFVLAGGLALISGLIAWWRIRGRSAPLDWIALATVAAIAWSFIGQQEEYFHIFEYGILGYLTSLGIGAKRLLPVGFCLVVSLGDEFIQYLTPDRYADWRDLAINFLAALMGQMIALPCDSALDPHKSDRSS